MIEIVKPDTKIDFVDLSSIFRWVSGFAVLACVLGVFLIGPNYGIDFKGGTEVVIKLSETLDSAQVREAFDEAGVPASQVQHFGGEDSNEWMVQTQRVSVVSARNKADAGPGDVAAESVVDAISGIVEIEDWQWAIENPDRLDITLANPDEADTEAAVAAIQEKTSLSKVTMEKLTGGGDLGKFVIEFQGLQASLEAGLKEAIPNAYNPDAEGSQAGIQRLETVGARVGDQLRNSGILSVIVALFWILIYVGFRFDLRYAPGAVAALTHDVIIAVGFFTFTQLEITLPIIAALLTIVGYSLNDTIVVFDRIRENTETAGGTDLKKISNKSINETLSRTLITSLTTLLAVGAIAFIATGLIQNFAIALIVGVIVGTYSSVFVATPIMLKMDELLRTWREARETVQKQESKV
jgi:preprotein translocase subunit SecF